MFLALRELQHYRFRSLLLGGIVALIAFMVFMITGLTRGLAQDSAALMIGTKATHFVTTKDAEGVFTRSFLTADEVGRLKTVAGKAATPLAQSFASFSTGDRQLSGVLVGVDPQSFMTPQATEGASLNSGTTGAVVDESFREDGVDETSAEEHG